MSVRWVITAILLSAVSGVPGLFLHRSSGRGQWIAATGMVGAALAGLTGAWMALRPGPVSELHFPWPAAGDAIVGVDALSAFFLVPVFLMGGLGAIYGLGYWPQAHKPENGRKLRLFWGLLVAGMALLAVARHAMAFLFGWELMALSAFFLVSTDDCHEDCRAAGWVYLIATHIGTLTLFALFALWRQATGFYILQPVAVGAMGYGPMHVLFLMGLLAFGMKAGMMPLHFWLPGAHANAPSHVSAILSGVVLKMGIYGLIRWISLFPAAPASWGGLVLALGVVSGLLGVVFALAQHDLKRLLAYHSVENIGIILMGLGVAMLGRAHDRPAWIVLGMAGCLLHVWNHFLFKSLLFLCAGSVLHGVGTRQLDRLGGLARTMPWTTSCFLVGAVAICGLPPLNGFVSEWFVYMGLLKTAVTDGAGGSVAVLAAPALAMIGALAVACFVKVYGTAFLGNPRTEEAAHAREASIVMRIPMVALAACCVLIGVAPELVVPSLQAAVASWMPDLDASVIDIRRYAPLRAIGAMAAALIAGAALVAALTARRRTTRAHAVTWDCGYARPTARMQYTASSFAQSIVALFVRVLRPSVHGPRVAGVFPGAVSMHSHTDDAILDRVLVPFGHAVQRWFGWVHRFQRGLTQNYLLYMLIAVVLLLGSLIPFKALMLKWVESLAGFPF